MIKLNLRLFGGRGSKSGSGGGSSSSGAGGGGGEPRPVTEREQEELKKQSEDWYYFGLTDDERRAVASSLTNNTALNEYLSGRGNYPQWEDSLKKEAKDLDSALSKFELDHDIVTYRGVSPEEFANTLWQDETTQGFKSSSYDLGRAQAFAQAQGGNIIEYHISKGNNGADVNGFGGALGEKEFLLRNDIPQRVVGQRANNWLIVEVG